MNWWEWMILGVALLAGEMLTVGLILLFFGIAALIVGALVAVGVTGAAWTQWIIFAVLSIGLMITLRRHLSKWRGPSTGKQDLNGIIGAVAISENEIAADGVGRVEMRGTTWNARNVAKTPIMPGQRCLVEKMEGLTIFIRPE